jgi:hypothetical protein
MASAGKHPAGISSWRRSPARQATGVSLSAVAVIVLAACSSGGKPAGSPPASAPSGGPSATTRLTPAQAVVAAATQAQQVTSATETLNIDVSGASSSVTSGIIQVRLKPVLLISESLNQTTGTTKTQIKAILTSTAMYLSETSLASQLGKPWVEIPLSALSNFAGTSIAQLMQSLQGNNFARQAQLFTLARNTRAAGTQATDGVATTEYAGSFTAADGLKALPAAWQQLFGPALRAMGNSTIYFREWIDGQHHLRKMTEIETVNGDTVTTTINVTKINQPFKVTLPPASQTAVMPDSSPASGSPGKSGLAAKIIPAPAGFAASQFPGVHQGPMSAADFNQLVGGGNPAASLHFVSGYAVTYDSTSSTDSISAFLFQFATTADATAFKTGSASASPGKPRPDPIVPGAEDYDSSTASQGFYDHGVIGIKGTFVFVIDDATKSAAVVPLVETMARQQYSAL